MSPTYPNEDAAKSGRVLVRMPTSMHEQLMAVAQGEGVSMNQFICGVLAVAIDWQDCRGQRGSERVHHEIAVEMWRDRARRA